MDLLKVNLWENSIQFYICIYDRVQKKVPFYNNGWNWNVLNYCSFWEKKDKNVCCERWKPKEHSSKYPANKEIQ